MLIKNNSPVFLFILVSMLFFSCKKETPLDSLNFQVEKNGDGSYHCTWTKTNISTFEKYYISHSPFLIEEKEDIFSSANCLTIIEDQTMSETTIVLPPEEAVTLKFQLLIDVGDRLVRSEVVTIENDQLEIIKSRSGIHFHVPEKKSIYFYDLFSNEMILYNYEEKQIKLEKTVSIDFGLPEPVYVNMGYGEELYIVNENELRIFDANTLDLKEFYSISLDIFAVAAKNGLIVLVTEDSDHPMKIISRATMSELNSISTNNPSFYRRGILSLPESENSFVEFGQSYISYFELGEQGQILSQTEKDNPFISFGGFSEGLFILRTSLSGDYIVNGYKGHVYDDSLNAVKDLDNGSLYANFFFDQEDNYLYAFNLFSNNQVDYIDKFSIPDFELVERDSFFDKTPYDMFQRDGELYLVCFSYTYKCYVIKPY